MVSADLAQGRGIAWGLRLAPAAGVYAETIPTPESGHWYSLKLIFTVSALLWCFAARRGAQAMAIPFASTATPRRDTTGKPVGLICQRPWLRCGACKGLRPFAARCALP